MQGTVAVHSFSHSSASWTIETFMCEVFPFSFSHCSLTDMAVSFSSAHVLDLDCFATNVIPLPVFSPQLDCSTMLDSTPVVGFSRGPVRKVKRSAKVVPHP